MRLKYIFAIGAGLFISNSWAENLSDVTEIEMENVSSNIDFVNPNRFLTIEPNPSFQISEVNRSITEDGRDNRIPVSYGQSEYFAIGRLQIYDGTYCTGSLSEITGYQSKNSLPIIITAAHCVDGIEPLGLKFTMSYLSGDGSILDIDIFADNIHIDPLSDIAFIELSHLSRIPDEISPIQFKPMKIGETIPTDIVSFGYGADLKGLNSSSGEITQVGFWDMTSNQGSNYNGIFGNMSLVVAKGASGGPVIGTSAFAVNSYIDNNKQVSNAGMAVLMDYMVASVPFLKPIVSQNVQCAKVTASNLNVRKGPSTDFEKIGSLPNGVNLEILDFYRDWVVINLGGADYGFVSSQYLKSTPCPL